MSNKFQPGEEIFDEVAGHGISSNRAVEDDDTEGHATRIKLAVPEDEDTEGHGIGSNRVVEDETEGHMPRIRIAVPQDEDTEGHTGFVKRAVEDEDTEGHAGSRNF